jgi:hypothetical protein
MGKTETEEAPTIIIEEKPSKVATVTPIRKEDDNGHLRLIFLLSFAFVGIAIGLGVLKYLGMLSESEE